MKPAVILVSPQGAGNVGGIARLMANFSLDDLRIVNPRCDLKSDECRMMAVKAYSIIEQSKVFSSLAEAQSDLEWSFALSAMEAQPQAPSLSLSQFFDTRLTEISSQSAWAFVFGREDHGLEREEIRACDSQIQIPSSKDYDSINLTSATAIVLSTWFQKIDLKPEETQSLKKPKKQDEDVFFEGLEKMLSDIKFINNRSPRQVMIDLRDMYRRANMRDRDLRILFGILQDLEYKFDQKFFRN